MRRLGVSALACGALACLLLAASSVRADDRLATEIVIWPIEPKFVGADVVVTVDLRLVGGGPLVDLPIELYVNGERLRRGRTDSQGSVSFWLPSDLAPGEYRLSAAFAGSTEFVPAAAEMVLVIVPFDLRVETVPPLPGMAFSLDGARFVAGEDGVARISVERAGDHTLVVLDGEFRDPRRRAEFSRWNTELFGPEITVTIPQDTPLQAGFDIQMPASQTFVALDGTVIDPSRVTSLTLRSSLGNVLTYPDGGERWFKASRTVRRPDGLESVLILYNVDAVEVDGSNVVNAGQHRFYVEPGVRWQIELLLYSARLQTRDALFGFAAGSIVDVLYPNGSVVQLRPDQDGRLAARGLARGIYRMTVADAPGWAPTMPVALSRDQDVVLRVITYLDMAVGVLVALAIGLGLLHRGRPHLIPGAMRAGAARVEAVRSLPVAAAAATLAPLRRHPTRREAPVDPTPIAVQAVPQSGGWTVAYRTEAAERKPRPVARPRSPAQATGDAAAVRAPKHHRAARRSAASRGTLPAAPPPRLAASVADGASPGSSLAAAERVSTGEGATFGQPRGLVPYLRPSPAILPVAPDRPRNGGSFWEASAHEVASATGLVGVQYCDLCGLLLSATARFCRRCGLRLEPIPADDGAAEDGTVDAGAWEATQAGTRQPSDDVEDQDGAAGAASSHRSRGGKRGQA